MGEHADYAIEKFFGFGLTLGSDHPTRKRRNRSYQSGCGKYKWRTKDGVLAMSDMTTEHLQAALRIAQERGSGKADQLQEVLSKRRDQSYYPE